MNDSREIYLYAVLGLSPAVLTETIWSLATRKKPVIPYCITIFTTNKGREALEEHLAEHWDAMVNALKKKGVTQYIPRLQTSRKIILSNGRDDLDDIRTQEDNLKMADQMLQKIRDDISDKKRPIVYASIAGGRKTMGAMLHSVMSLIGGGRDKIFHILTDKTPPKDSVYPWQKKEPGKPFVELELAEVPFVPLAGMLKKEDLGRLKFNELLRAMSESVAEKSYNFSLNAGESSLVITETSTGEKDKIKLGYVGFLILSTFFRRAMERKNRNENVVSGEFNFFAPAAGETEYESDLRREYNRICKKIRADKIPSAERLKSVALKSDKSDIVRRIKKSRKSDWQIIRDMLLPSRCYCSNIDASKIGFEDYE
ncbi:MAG: TIGR02584 family CRISPR-associated protein [Opitutales bacterium]|nr:TIGR02584 family CRISPR-associated protein [Opitutales bacterium]